jgi:G patch domain-containing protein 1
MSVAMAQRFTTGSSETVKEMEKARVNKGGIQEASAVSEKVPEEKPVQDTFIAPHGTPATAIEAAKMGMYGVLTRTIIPFKPTRLLCKRMNIADPHAEEGAPATQDNAPASTTKDVLTEDKVHQIMIDAGHGHLVQEMEEAKKRAKEVLDEKKLQEEEEQRMDIDGQEEGDLVQKGLEELGKGQPLIVIPDRPPMDIFKAVFDDSDTDMDEDEEEQEDTVEDMQTDEPPLVPSPSTQIQVVVLFLLWHYIRITLLYFSEFE